MVPPQDYKYDVFISYPRQQYHTDWLNEYFLKYVTHCLTEELGYEPHIFIDREHIKVGDAWPERLKHALARSRILVPIWSTQYFLSHWCCAEWVIFVHRQTQYGYGTIQNPNGLICPIQLFDGKNYPKAARNMQALDCRDANHVHDAFKRSEGFISLQRRLEGWATQVAQAISQVPAWSPSWLEPSWNDDPIQQYKTHPDFQGSHQWSKPPSLAGD